MKENFSFKIVIPARYASTRLPRKPLLDIAGKPMVQHVYERALASGASEVVVATDHPEIEAAVKAFGGNVVMTSEDCPTGTDRMAEVAKARGWGLEDIVVNVQGDEPLIPESLIRHIAEALVLHPDAGISTAACPITDHESLENPNIVKVVFREDHRALYFSRFSIPFHRDHDAPSREEVLNRTYWRHIGIYGYRVATLLRFTELAPCVIEKMESLEQLRALYHGIDIQILPIEEAPPHGVDTKEDYQKMQEHFAESQAGNKSDGARK